MLPVVVVAEAPISTTCAVSEVYTAKLSVVVAHALEPPLPLVSVPHAGNPPETLSTFPVEPTGSTERVPALFA